MKSTSPPAPNPNDFSVITNPTDIEAKGPVILQATMPPPNEKGIITTTTTLIVRADL